MTVTSVDIEINFPSDSRDEVPTSQHELYKWAESAIDGATYKGRLDTRKFSYIVDPLTDSHETDSVSRPQITIRYDNGFSITIEQDSFGDWSEIFRG